MPPRQDLLRPPPGATNTRRVMLGFAVSVAFITYLDRVCISAAAPSMQRELGLSVSQMGYVFSIFALAYGVFEIPMGWFGDRYGQRRLLARIVSCWSVFTILTGLVRGYASLLTTRFVFGAAEAGAFPTLWGTQRPSPRPDGWVVAQARHVMRQPTWNRSLYRRPRR